MLRIATQEGRTTVIDERTGKILRYGATKLGWIQPLQRAHSPSLTCRAGLLLGHLDPSLFVSLLKYNQCSNILWLFLHK